MRKRVTAIRIKERKGKKMKKKVIRTTKMVPETYDVCPYCNKKIGEKEIYYKDGEWFHRPCIDEGSIEYPEPEFDPNKFWFLRKDDVKCAAINRDKDLVKKKNVNRVKRRRPVRKDVKKSPGMKTRDKRDPDFVDVVKDKDLKLSEDRRKMMNVKTASLTNTVGEFSPGQMVIQIYPVARPLVGVVTGSSRVEGKVYVSWNGRVTQHDPEEIQLASVTPLFSVAKGIYASKNGEFVERYASALGQFMKEQGASQEMLATCFKDHGFDAETADKLAASYVDACSKKASLNCALNVPEVATCGEVVVILNDGGRRPGTVGVMVGREGVMATVDVNTSWSTSRRDGSKLIQVPLVSVVPIESHLNRRNEEVHVHQHECPCSDLCKKLACEMFFTATKNITVFKNPSVEASVGVLAQSSATDNDKVDVMISGVVKTFNGEDVVCSNKVAVALNGNKADFGSSMEVINSEIDTCRNKVLKYVRENVYPAHVVADHKRFLEENKNELPKERTDK